MVANTKPSNGKAELPNAIDVNEEKKGCRARDRRAGQAW
jgi:hypothetical protein